MFNYRNNSWNLKYEKSKSILLKVKELERQCYIKKVDVIQKERDLEKINNFETINVNHNINLSQEETIFKETGPKTVPNILKRHPKLNRTMFSQLNEKDRMLTFEDENNAQISFISTENSSQKNKCFKKETKYKHVSNRRKQGLDFTDVWYESSNCNMCSFIDDDNKISDKGFFTPVKPEIFIKKRKTKHCAKQQDKKNQMSLLKTKQKEDLFPVSNNVSTDLTSDCYSLSSLQEFESMDVEDSIDFSSNEIFSKFNYEYYGDNSLSCSIEYTMDSNQTHNSLSTTNDSDTNEKKYDLNSNTIGTCETGYKYPQESLVSSEYLDPDISLWDDQKFSWSCDSYCDYCFENCVSSWITTNELKSNILLKDRVLTAAIYENIHTNNEINYPHLDNMYWGNDSPTKTDNKRLSTSTNYTDGIDLSLTKLLTHYDEYNNNGKILEDTVNFDQREKCKIFNDYDDIFFETDFYRPAFAFEEQITTECPTNILQTKEDEEHNSNNEIFQCSLCLLTFSNARTLAMHQAGAHGGSYAILCESCGRLFNRKYHFNRHFIHCGHMKEPFRCDMCLKTYRHKSSLVHHLRETHRVHYTRKRSTKFTCRVCNKIYRKFGAFENHVKKHQDTAHQFWNYSNDV